MHLPGNAARQPRGVGPAAPSPILSPKNLSNGIELPSRNSITDKVNHGYHNDTTPRYDEAAAKLAWSRTVEFLNQNLRENLRG